MPGKLQSRLGIILVAAALAGCNPFSGSKDILVEKTERVPCPLALAKIECPQVVGCPEGMTFPEFSGGQLFEAEVAFKCGRIIDQCKAAQIRLWEADHAACVDRLRASGDDS